MSWFSNIVPRTKKAISNYGDAWNDVFKSGDIGQLGSDIGNSALDFWGVGENTQARKYVNSDFYQSSFGIATGVGLGSAASKVLSKSSSDNKPIDSTSTSDNDINFDNIPNEYLIAAAIFLL